MTTAESDKLFKEAEHRRERRAVRSAIKAGDDLPHPRKFGDPWDGQKDGKRWLDGRDSRYLRK
ncbi:hypothetical protein D584_01293 [Brucella intermedia M86]|uniref:Uncharacterized protein n=2 Tax=Brucella intermedia TaxID=94625 RepID=M5K508_9HYPH|nr:hypothetical protein D584_01293 [Brucella intermedia M86]